MDRVSTSEERTIEDADGVLTISHLRPKHAAALRACFVRCYGDTYAVREFYDESALAALISSGDLSSVVALDGTKVVGHTGITRRYPDALVGEAGNTVVDPDYRGRRLLSQLGADLRGLCLARGLIGYVHFPTTAHEIMQRTSVRGGGVETGLMLAYVPAETEYRAVGDAPVGRLAVTVAYQPFSAAPARTIVVPACYDEITRAFFDQAGITRHRGAGRTLPPHSRVQVRSSDARGVLTVHCPQAGDDLAATVAALWVEHEPALALVDLHLTDAMLDDQVAALQAQGFVYCALLPEFANGDVLRLQRLSETARATAAPLQLANAGAQEIARSIAAEELAATSAG